MVNTIAEKYKSNEHYAYKTETGIERPISDGTLKILKWKNEYGVSIRGICSKSFKEIVSDLRDVHCRALMHGLLLRPGPYFFDLFER